jgi:hypothetical protein
MNMGAVDSEQIRGGYLAIFSSELWSGHFTKWTAR